MKRSKSIALVMMSASTIALSACDEPTVDAAVFDTLEQCISDPVISESQCRSEFAVAKQQHVKAAPKYTSKTDCEADFGAAQCEQAPQRTQSGGSVFMPLMMGYMMGSMLSGGRRGVASQPLYRSTDDPKNYRTADNKKIGGKTGATKVAQSAARSPSVKTSTVSRGGFGARARSTGFTGRS
jgi:uncharacterized protein YgiB involved in biofilm formation